MNPITETIFRISKNLGRKGSTNIDFRRSLCVGPHKAGHRSFDALNLGDFHTLM
jgi:hypothetical protein